MYDYNISGIQQVGIGVEDAEEAWRWYAMHFGMDLPIFNDEAEASLMKGYTGGKVHKRKAILAMNLNGGGGFEVWQFTSRKPTKRAIPVKEGDLGISHVHLRTRNVSQAHAYFMNRNDVSVSTVKRNDLGKRYFEITDPFSNQFKIIEDDYQFMPSKSLVGGVMGVTIGVSNIDEGRQLYTENLKYDSELSRKKEGSDLERLWLSSSDSSSSAFSDLLGPTKLELVCSQVQSEPIFKNRFWGDLGFIHVCFDVQKMGQLRKQCEKSFFPFRVDSENSFDMGEAAGQFAYVQDKDDTLIELVETHKVPIFKKLGWYINLKNKKKQKPLPRFIFKAMSWNRVKFN